MVSAAIRIVLAGAILDVVELRLPLFVKYTAGGHISYRGVNRRTLWAALSSQSRNLSDVVQAKVTSFCLPRRVLAHTAQSYLLGDVGGGRC